MEILSNILGTIIVIGVIGAFINALTGKKENTTETQELKNNIDKKEKPEFILTYKVESRANTLQEDQISNLLSISRVHRTNKEWKQAFACLRKAYTLMETTQTAYTIADFLMLPEFMMLAGMQKEALVEYNKLLSTARVRTQKDFSHQTKKVIDQITASDKVKIYSSMSKYFGKTDEKDKALEYEELTRIEQSLYEKLKIENDKASDKKRKAVLAKREAKRKAQ